MDRHSHSFNHSEDRLRALCALSDVVAPIDISHFINHIQETPDPETAVQLILMSMPSASAALTRQWRNFIVDTWAKYHPGIPIMPNWPISSATVDHSPLLSDARAFLDIIKRQPIRMSKMNHEWLIDSDEILRIIRLLPSFSSFSIEAVESEWNILPLRRLRSLLQSVRLARVVKGELVPIMSRLKRFEALPSSLQFYILWHADVYHVSWAEFSGLWHKYMRLMQEYIPLLWETVIDAEPGQLEDRALWAVSLLESFTPLWDEEGLLDLQKGQGAALQIVQQHALPTVVDRFILRDLLERHGLVTITEEFGSLSKFSWTQTGLQVISAEDNQIMPCGNHLLDAHPQLTADLSR